MAQLIVFRLMSPVAAFACAPVLTGMIAKTKAFFAGRRGPPLFQSYYDLIKLLQKGAVYGDTSSWIFRAGPVVSLGAALVACCLIPFASFGVPLSFSGDLIFFACLLGVMRFFTVIAALDTGSPFEGMGASREVFFSALAEPVFILGLLSVARGVPSLRMDDIFGAGIGGTLATRLLAGTTLFAVTLAENARIPVDDPATHLELTMIHEVMVLDHGGPDFAFITYGASLKLWLFCLITVRTLLPFHAASPITDSILTALCMVALAGIIGVVESVMARLRLIRVPQLLAGAGALSVLALLFGLGVMR